MMNELKNKLEELARIEEIANKASEEYETEPTNEAKEKAFNEAYIAEFYAFIEARDFIVEATNGRINKYTADLMLNHNRNEILNRID